MDEVLQGLGGLLTKAVRTSSPAADRRGERRRALMLEAELTIGGTRGLATLTDLSETGARVVTELAAGPGATGELRLAEVAAPIAVEVVARRHQTLSLHFRGTGLPGAAVDQMAASGIARMIEVTIGDHRAYVARIAEAVAGRQVVLAAALPTHHTCRLGRWYDGVADEALTALPSFQALAGPHRAVHDAGRAVLKALEAGQAETAVARLAELEVLSQAVVAALRALGAEYTGRHAA